MSGHTPGPWQIKYDNADCRSGGQWYSVGPARICFGYGSTKEQEQQALDDARLIASAPDLLAALQTLVDGDAKDREDGLRLYQNGSPRDKTWGSARAAIAKAEGSA
jgi:hypothetical protein